MEKATRDEAALLAPHKATVLAVLESSDQPDVQWQLVQCVPRLPLGPTELPEIICFMQRCFDTHSSRILRTHCLQALYDLASRSPKALATAREAIGRGRTDPVASVRARARRLSREMAGIEGKGGVS